MRPLRFTIVCRPTTKKTANRTFDIGKRCGACRRGERTIVKPSELFEQFEEACSRPLQLAYATRESARIQCTRCDRGRYQGKTCIRCGGTTVCALPISRPVFVEAVVYRERNAGDVTGYQQALGDILQTAGVIANDSLIAMWIPPADGGWPLRKDAERPRIELVITEAAQTTLELETA